MMSFQPLATTGAPSGNATGPTLSPTGWMALLQENDLTVQDLALQKLLEQVHEAWHEIAECLPELEAMADDRELPPALQHRAAAVASRVLFHLQEPQQALRLALQAGMEYFDPMDHRNPYVERLVQAALDAYTQQLRQERSEGMPDASATVPHAIAADEGTPAVPTQALQTMVYTLMESSCRQGNYIPALGIAIEAHEAERFRVILEAGIATDPTLLKYALQMVLSTITSKSFRMQALQVLSIQLQTQFKHHKQAAYDLIVVYQLLQQPEPVAEVLQQLLQGTDPDDSLLALQLCFDLMDTGNQAFCQQVAQQIHHEQALRILTGGFVGELALSFLYKHNQTDRAIMDNLKKALDERSSRSSLLHNAAVLTHSYLYAGTTNDSFLRQNLDWMKKASNWAKFSATASLGVLHAGHVTEAMNLLQPYLPPDPTEPGNEVSSTGGYSEGGSLYALGIMHGRPGTCAQRRNETTEFIRKHLRASHANEVISHGACLGVGLTAMGSANVQIVRELKEILDTDSAVAGEAAGIAMGLVLVGTGAGNTLSSLKSDTQELADIVTELKNYARETQHEKIIRGIAMGLALIQYGQEEGADALIEELRSDRDPIMRYGAQYATALAYCGTGSNKAIRILLHTAVSDVSDDVRMAAVIGLAFVLFKTPERVPQLVKLLLESFNPHVRYASCMAVGIAMAGTGNAESVALLEPMLDDMTDYVRQGAFMGTAMIYMQQSDATRRSRSFRERVSSTIQEKHQSTLTKMGAILATGILDAGGRNCAVQLQNRFGFTKMSTAIGLTMWLQYWHWYPMMHMWSIAMTPTYTIGLNHEFKYPKKFEIQCNAKPSQFAYPKKLEEKKEEKKKRVETVTLSTTAKEKARLARLRAKLGLDSSMDVEEEAPKEVEEEKEDTKPKKVKEPNNFRIPNPARVTVQQSALCEFVVESKYRPVRENEKPLGIILLKPTVAKSELDDEEWGVMRSPTDEPEGELPPPEPFLWTPPE